MEEHKDIVKKVVDYIEDNLETEIDLEMIAQHVGYSKFHLNRIFTEETGSTIYKYLQARRLTLAADKLVNTDKAITMIAYEASYNSQQAFSLAFKQMYLYPPKVYRDRGVFIPKQIKMYNSIHLCEDMFTKYVRKIEVMAA